MKREDVAPAGDEFVVGAGVLRETLAFAQDIERVGERAGRLARLGHPREELARLGRALRPQDAHEVVARLPRRAVAVLGRIVVLRIFLVAQEPHLAARGGEHARVADMVHRRPLRAGENVRLAERPLAPGARREEVAAEARRRVEVVVAVEQAVDLLDGIVHGHPRAVRVADDRILRVDLHSRANGRLRKVHRRDGRRLAVQTLHVAQRVRHRLLQFVKKRAPLRLRRVRVPLAANENDGGSKGVGAMTY